MSAATIIAFIRAIGLPCDEGATPERCFVPGITLLGGGIVYDPQKMAYPGDLLHEAGHLAVMTPERRQAVAHSAGQYRAEEMMAIAWSYAAARHIGIDPAVVFHEGGYRGGGSHLVENFNAGYYVGVPMLAWLGLTRDPTARANAGQPCYPQMARWLLGGPEL